MNYPLTNPPQDYPIQWDSLPFRTMGKGQAFLIPADQLTLEGKYRVSGVNARIHNRALRAGIRVSLKKSPAGLWVTRIA